MDTVSEAPDESSNNSSQVKSENGSPQHDGGRSSPPPNCAICLGRCRNKSFTDSCLHQFCFKCLLTWSRVKTECPLCKQNFKSIIHNVKSNHQYEEYPVGPHDITEELVNAARRFRYRTTLTIPRRDTLAIQQFLLHYPLALVDVPRGRAARRAPDFRRTAADFRCTVYRHNLWARPLPDFTGRFRDCTPDFFRYNDSQVHRLIPWLNRELFYLLNENTAHIAYVLERIVELLPRYPIVSPDFRTAVICYFGDRTDHFLHEFHCFASTPYDLTGYDRHVQYATDARHGPAAVVNEVLSSSDSDTNDSDIVMVSSSHPAPPAPAPAPAAPAPAAGPSHAPAPVYPRTYIPQPAVIPIETISHSDSDSSEVMVVGYIKPPHQRTPELVDLLNSDSDVVVHEGAEPAPHVRVTMSRARRLATPPAPPPRRRRRRAAPPPADSDSGATATPPFSSDDDSYEDSTDESSSSAAERTRRARRKARRRAPRPARPRRKRYSHRRKKAPAAPSDERAPEGSPARAGDRTPEPRAAVGAGSDGRNEASDGTPDPRPDIGAGAAGPERASAASPDPRDGVEDPTDRSEVTSDASDESRNGIEGRTDRSEETSDRRLRSRRTEVDRRKESKNGRDEARDPREGPHFTTSSSFKMTHERRAPPDGREESPDRRHESRERGDGSREKNDTRKGKSKNGKGVKSSLVELSQIPLPPTPTPAPAAEPGPSGAAHKRKRAPSAADNRHKRLKSVVTLIQRGASDSGADVPARPERSPAPDRPRPRLCPDPAPRRRDSAPARSLSVSSSDDNIPLHLTLPKYKRFDLTSRT